MRAALPDLDSQRLQAIHRIGVLLGEEPTALMQQLERLTVPCAFPPCRMRCPVKC